MSLVKAAMAAWTAHLKLMRGRTSTSVIDKLENKYAEVAKAVQLKGYSNRVQGYIHDILGKLTHFAASLSLGLLANIACLLAFVVGSYE